MKDFFGPDRVLLGHPDQEWAVWISGPDDIRECISAEDAMQFALAHNTGFALIDFRSGSEFDPALYAVVLRNGYAWTPEAEHRAGRDCGAKHCEHCAPARTTTARS